VNLSQTMLLGAIAGLTIYLGLPIGRLSRVDDRLRVGLAMLSVGVLAFIFMDVASHAQTLIQGSLDRYRQGVAGIAPVIGRFALIALGITTGAAGIPVVERYVRRRAPRGPAMVGGDAAGAVPATGPVAAAGVSGDAAADAARQRALHTAMTIAVAIGLHNFAEGLAIGVSAKAGAIGLATVLVVGFGLHNATEGFGIVGPLGGVRPSWSWLGVAGLVAGGPTFLGSVVGYQVHSDALELAFYALAGGAILYVVGEIWTGVRRYGHKSLGLTLLAVGYVIGVATDLVVAYGGG